MTATIQPRVSFADKSDYANAITLASTAFANAAMRQNALDPVLTELVRLRCARVHDCRLCQSFRSEVALQNGMDAAMDAKVDRYESSDLDERTKVALRLTDAMIMAPGDISEELREQVRRQFSDAEVVELVMDIVKWSYQKALVALRLEQPPREGLTLLSFDESGRAVPGLAMSVERA
jgi:alkylhydroperoxidase family enzyme